MWSKTGTESEPSCRSTRKKGQPESTTKPNSTTPRNIPSHQIDGIELGASNVVVPTTMDFSSEDEVLMFFSEVFLIIVLFSIAVLMNYCNFRVTT